MDALSAAIAIVVGLLAIAIPALLAWKYASRHKLKLKIAILGATFFIFFQLFHVPLVLLTQNAFYSAAGDFLGDFGAKVALAAYLGILAALFEELGRYLVFTRVMKEKGTGVAKLFGLGWGGIESVIFVGLLATVGIFATDALFAGTDSAAYGEMLSAQGMPSGEVEQAVAAYGEQKAAWAVRNPFDSFVALYERLVAIAFHVVASVLVMKSAMDGRKDGLLVALAGHFMLDFTAVMAAATKNMYFVELAATAVVICFALLAARMMKVSMAQFFELAPERRVRK